MMKQSPLSSDSAQDVAIQALTFVAGDPAVLSRFLDVTGWTAESLHAPDTRESMPLSALEFLMSAEDLLLTFAANAGLDPADVNRAYYTLQNSSGPASDGRG